MPQAVTENLLGTSSLSSKRDSFQFDRPPQSDTKTPGFVLRLGTWIRYCSSENFRCRMRPVDNSALPAAAAAAVVVLNDRWCLESPVPTTIRSLLRRHRIRADVVHRSRSKAAYGTSWGWLFHPTSVRPSSQSISPCAVWKTQLSAVPGRIVCRSS